MPGAVRAMPPSRRTGENAVTSRPVWCLLVSVLTAAAGEDAAEPAAHPRSRYDALCARSPFTREVAAETVSVAPNFAPHLALIGTYHLDGCSFAILLDRRTQERHTAASEPAPTGPYRLVALTVGENPAQTTALVEREAQRATIGFDPAGPRRAALPASTPASPPGTAGVVVPAPTPGAKPPLERMRIRTSETASP